MAMVDDFSAHEREHGGQHGSQNGAHAIGHKTDGIGQMRDTACAGPRQFI